MPHSRRIGSEAEDQAADYLLGLGYTLIGRRIKMSCGELDIIAFDEETLVFVEVKLRQTRAEEALTSDKVSKIMDATEEYLYKHNLQEKLVRFDFVVIDRDGLRHHKNAFQP